MAPGTDDETIKAWAAGFFDGEGCVLINLRPNNSLHCILDVTNTQAQPLKFLQSFYGGGITQKFRKPPRRHVYVWQLSGQNSEMFARDILPYSIIKKTQLELYLHVRTLFSDKRVGITEESLAERIKVVEECKKLKKVAI